MSTIKVNNIESSTGGGVAAKLASVNGGFIGTKNLVINGAMQVAQRETSSLANGIRTVDRFAYNSVSIDGSPTQAQADVASGTTPYSLGFRKSYKVTNGNQTSGAQAASLQQYSTRLEAQDIANSGWNYTDPNSKITLSFWCKSSVAQNFYGFVNTIDGTSQQYPFETGTLTADTWTKISKVISGNSNLQFDNDTNVGLIIYLGTYFGTDYTDSSVTLNAWGAYGSGDARTPNFTSTWYTTNDATFELTGVQLEVSNVATFFEHKSFAQQLQLCKRYYQKSYNYPIFPAAQNAVQSMIISRYSAAVTNRADLATRFECEMRATPTLTVYRPFSGGANQIENFGSGIGTVAGNGRTFTVQNLGRKGLGGFTLDSATSGSLGYHYQIDAEI